VILIWPFTGKLVGWLEQRFGRSTRLQLQNLDASSLLLHDVAIKTLSMESLRTGQLIADQAYQLTQGKNIADGIDQIKQLQSELAHYVLLLVKQQLSEAEAEAVNKLLQNQLRLEMALQLLPNLVQQQQKDPQTLLAEQQYWQLLSQTVLPDEAAKIRQGYREHARQRDKVKKQLYKLVLTEQMSKDSGGDQLLRLAELRRFNQQLTKAILALGRLQQRSDLPATEDETDAD
jgi:phosphate:Na+ symporter